jgi:hypothetical protein
MIESYSSLFLLFVMVQYLGTIFQYYERMKVVMHNSLSLLTILIPYNIFIFSLNTSRREHHSLINCAFTTPLADIALFPSLQVPRLANPNQFQEYKKLATLLQW